MLVLAIAGAFLLAARDKDAVAQRLGGYTYTVSRVLKNET
jgi:hypothetical protein